MATIPSDDSFRSVFDSAELARSDNSINTKVTTSGDVFWDFGELRETNWNKSFPFRLVILQRHEKSWMPVTGPIDNKVVKYTKFTLPIPPQEMTITTPFAINTVATLGGILEEHNGAPFRMINLSGTTGIMPLKDNSGIRKTGSLVEGLFQNTIRATETLVTSFTNSFSIKQNNIVDIEMAELKNSSGYAQFMLLRNFLESYVALKKTAEGSKYALGFSIFKDKETYLVTPVSFQLNRSAQSPMEYSYSIQLKAWRRIPLLDSVNFAGSYPQRASVRDANKIAQAFNEFRSARAALQNRKNVLVAIRADFNKTVFQGMREAGLFAKDRIGVPTTAMDLPIGIVQDMRDSVLASFGNVNQGLNDFKNARQSHRDGVFNNLFKETVNNLQNLSMISGIKETKANSIKTNKSGLSSGDPLENNNNLGNDEAAPGNDVFKGDPDKNAAILDSIQLGSLSIKTHVSRKIAEERARVAAFTRQDFEQKRNDIIEAMSVYADFVGASGASYNQTYSRETIDSNRTPNDDDWDIIFNLNQVASFYNLLAASTAIDSSKKMEALEYISNAANGAGIPFRVPASAYAVPFPYGSTLEILAQRYLDNVDRWHEIATLNNLRAPYVDEEGFSLSLLVNGDRNEIRVNSIENIKMGQNVWLSSATQSREKRKVINIKTLSTDSHILYLSGALDLDRFKKNDNAKIDAFLPGTVNSLQMIWIPSDNPPAQPDLEPKPNSTLQDFEQLLQAGGADLLLKENGDLAVTQDGDCKIAVGLQNIIQTLKLSFSTEMNSLLHHQDYGFGVSPGTSTAEISAEQILSAAKKSIQSDPTFSGVVAANVEKKGPVLSIGLSVGVNGFNQLIPINFTLRNQS